MKTLSAAQQQLDAEGRLEGAMSDLAEVASVKEESRGVVITLSGSVLFPIGEPGEQPARRDHHRAEAGELISRASR